MIFNFYKKGSKTKKLNLLEESDIVKARMMLNEGYTRAKFPASHSAKHTWNETDLRAKDFKWDTVVKKYKRMKGSSLLNPALTLRAIDRNGFNAQHIKYHVAITIEAPKYVGSLYDIILQTYKNLEPIQLRNINQILQRFDKTKVN